MLGDTEDMSAELNLKGSLIWSWRVLAYLSMYLVCSTVKLRCDEFM